MKANPMKYHGPSWELVVGDIDFMLWAPRPAKSVTLHNGDVVESAARDFWQMSWDHLEDENLGDCVRAKSFEAVAAAIQWSVPDDVRFSDVVRAFEAEVRKAEVSA